jgi:hypothetical protein
MAYCTITDVREYLGVELLDDDVLIQSLIDTAQAWIDTYCHRTFEASVDETRYVDASGDHLRGNVLYIDHVGELCSITSVVNGDGTTVDASDYVTTPRGKTPFYAIRLKTMAPTLWRWTDDWEDAIAITGRWAYSITAPEPIKQACVQLVGFYYRQKDQPYLDVTAVEAGVVIRPSGIPNHIKMMLRGYVKP